MYESDITWKSDREKKFKNPKSVNTQKYKYLDESFPGLISLEKSNDSTKSNYHGGGVQDEHFIVWMKTAALPHFRKLYGRITEDIDANTELEFTINANFPVYQFKGKKYIIVANTGWIGGKNSFLGICYLVVGILSCVIGVIFLIKHIIKPRKFGDVDSINWSKLD